jgi:hypothetical protein
MFIVKCDFQISFPILLPKLAALCKLEGFVHIFLKTKTTSLLGLVLVVEYKDEKNAKVVTLSCSQHDSSSMVLVMILGLSWCRHAQCRYAECCGAKQSLQTSNQILN